MPRQPRSSGAYSVVLGKVPIEANSLKELLRLVILKAERLRPGTIEEIAVTPTPKGRFIVARSAAQLYPKAPTWQVWGKNWETGGGMTPMWGETRCRPI